MIALLLAAGDAANYSSLILAGLGVAGTLGGAFAVIRKLGPERAAVSIENADHIIIREREWSKTLAERMDTLTQSHEEAIGRIASLEEHLSTVEAELGKVTVERDRLKVERETLKRRVETLEGQVATLKAERRQDRTERRRGRAGAERHDLEADEREAREDRREDS